MDEELSIFFKQDQNTQNKSNDQSKPAINQKPQVTVIEAKPNLRQTPMLSMKAFIYNFKKFYQQKTKIRNILSEPAAKQRNISLQIYIKNYLRTYSSIKQMLLLTREHEKECSETFKQLAFKDLYQNYQDSTRIYVKHPSVDHLADLCNQELERLFMSKESAFFEKKALINFIHPLQDSDRYIPLDYHKILNAYKESQYGRSLQIQTVGQFIKAFASVLSSLDFNISSSKSGQVYFKLVDVAHYLYENKYRRTDVDHIMKFMTKVKSLYNQSVSRQKDDPIDGDLPIQLEFITLAFSILTNKDKMLSDVIGEVIGTLRQLLNEHINAKTQERLRRVMELNIVADYLQKYFRDLDHQITEILTNIETVTELIEGGIEQLNLNTKQDQLEVLLGFMFRIQDHQMTEEVAEIAQKHKETLQQLEEQYEQNVEEARLKAHSNIDRKRDYEEEEEAVSELYENFDEKSYGDQQINNPYKDADVPVRRPKILDVNGIQAYRNPQLQSYIQNNQNEEKRDQEELSKSLRVAQHDELIRQVNDNKEARDEYLINQIQEKLNGGSGGNKEMQNLRISEIDDDQVYRQEFEKLKREMKGGAKKDEMIVHLQKKIEMLREQVQEQKRRN